MLKNRSVSRLVRNFSACAVFTFTTLFLGCGIFCGCSEPAQTPAKLRKISSPDQLNRPDCIFGGEIGTVSLKEGEKRFPKAQFIHFQTACDAYPALEAGKIDAIVYDKPPLDYAAMNRDAFFVMPEELAIGHIAVGAPFKNKELIEKVNEYIRRYRSDGTYKAMYERWIMTRNPEMPAIPRPAHPIGKLVVGTDSQNEPMTFMGKDGEVFGFDIEFVRRLALFLNMEYEHKIMSYDALFPAASTGKIDLAVGNLDVTEERRQTMLFSDEYLDCPVAVMIRRDRYAGKSAAPSAEASSESLNTWDSLCMSFDRTFIRENRWELVLKGLKVTIIITIFSSILGTILAFGVCAMRRSRRWYLRQPARWYIHVMQGTPMLVILMIFYYIIFAKWDIDGVYVAVIGFALNFSAYVGEMMRTGIDTVDKGQIEAAKALGFGRLAVFRKIVFPQAARRILPVYRGEFINLLKNTSIVGYIAIQDLTKMSDIIRSRTYEAFFPLISTAVIYFAVAQVLALLLAYLESRLNPAMRKRVVKGVVCK